MMEIMGKINAVVNVSIKYVKPLYSCDLDRTREMYSLANKAASLPRRNRLKELNAILDDVRVIYSECSYGIQSLPVGLVVDLIEAELETKHLTALRFC